MKGPFYKQIFREWDDDDDLRGALRAALLDVVDLGQVGVREREVRARLVDVFAVGRNYN